MSWYEDYYRGKGMRLPLWESFLRESDTEILDESAIDVAKKAFGKLKDLGVFTGSSLLKAVGSKVGATLILLGASIVAYKAFGGEAGADESVSNSLESLKQTISVLSSKMNILFSKKPDLVDTPSEVHNYLNMFMSGIAKTKGTTLDIAQLAADNIEVFKKLDDSVIENSYNLATQSKEMASQAADMVRESFFDELT